MVLQKRLYYGFNGFQVPAMPRGSRSARGKRSARNNAEHTQMCAFELLATVAGNLLLEEEILAPIHAAAGELERPNIKNSVKQDQQNEEKHPKLEPCDEGSCDEGTLPSDTYHQRLTQKFVSKECSLESNSMVLKPASIAVKSDKFGETDYKSTNDARKHNIRDTITTYHRRCSVQGYSAGSTVSHVINVVDGFTAPLQTDLQSGRTGVDGIVPDLLCTEDPLDLDSKPPTLVSSDSSVELPPYGTNIPHSSSFLKCRDAMELIYQDDDENSSRCTQPSTITSKGFKPHRVGDRRIRKLLASKFWKVGPTLLKDGEFSNTEAKSIFCSRRMRYTRQRTHRFSCKRKKLFEQSSLSPHSGEISSEVLSMSPEKGINGEGQQSLTKSEDQVKFSIKSFKLPEIFIEMSESATVGELKRTVLETVTAMLQNRLRVGVILQGKKVRDDGKTLLQTGIHHAAKVDGLGFSLEPNPLQAPQLTSFEDPHFLDPCDSSEPISWLPASPTSNMGMVDAKPDQAGSPTKTNNAESNLNVVPSTNTSLPDDTIPDSKTLVVVPSMDMEALAVAPIHRKSKRSELVQRRIRRPFSVSEVEALVQTVEKLGTGRWRDVKLRAFDNAKHRTYVDLKDKWKTLVHTASISPQQRRGEPVPQELLDRVLSAHAYWSQQQAKYHTKQHQQPDQCLLL